MTLRSKEVASTQENIDTFLSSSEEPNVDELLRMKRFRNAIAAKKCRIKKKNEAQARLEDLQRKVEDYEYECESLRKANDSLVEDKSKWKQKEALFNRLVRKLQNELEQHKSKIFNLEASLMALRMTTNRVHPQAQQMAMPIQSFQQQIPLQQQMAAMQQIPYLQMPQLQNSEVASVTQDLEECDITEALNFDVDDSQGYDLMSLFN